ncbi:MAG: polysaccharide biosynthesis C-terminal domain-containing protein [Sporolactobacillus sp.]
MSRYRKLALNSIIFAIGNLGSKLVGLFLVPLYTFFLTKQQYGSVDLLTTTYSLLLPIVTLSIHEAVLRFTMDKDYSKTAVLNNGLMLVLIGYSVGWLLFPIFHSFFPFQQYLIYFFIMLLLASINMTLTNFLRANNQILLFALLGIVSSITMLIATFFLLVYCHLGIPGYLFSFVISDAVSIIAILLFGKVCPLLSFSSVSITYMKQMIRYSVPLIPNTIMWWVMGVSDRYLILYMIGIGANGLYAVANKIPSVLSVVSTIFFQAWQLSAIEENQSESKSHFYSTIFALLSAILFAGTSLILVGLKPLIHWIIAPQFYQSWRYVPFLLLGVIFSSFTSFIGTNYIAAKKTSGAFQTSLIGAAVNSGANMLLIPLMGTNGASFATMLSFLVIWLLRVWDTRHFVQIHIRKRSFIGSLCLLFVQIILLYSTMRHGLLWQTILFFLVVMINGRILLTVLTKGMGFLHGKINQSIKL